MNHTIALVVRLFAVLLAAAASASHAQPEAEAPAQPEPVQPADDDPRLGVPTLDWRESLDSDRDVRDRLLTPGLWRGWITLPSEHEIGLTMDVDFRRDHFRNPLYSFTLLNGTESLKAELEQVAGPDQETPRLRLTFPGSNAAIEASVESGGIRLLGEYIYSRNTDAGPVEYRLPFVAINGDGRRFDTPEPKEPEAPPTLEPDWRVTFESREGPAVMSLRLLPDGRHVQGTVSTPTGDDGVLFGVFHDEQLRLSRFTGGSGILYTAALQPDGSLIGTYHSLAHHSETFTATPARDAVLPDLFEQTRWLEGVSPAELAFRDPGGIERSIGELAPGPALLYVFGSWCHNCTDATRYLKEIHGRVGDELSIVGIAFEAPATFEAQAERVSRYAQSKDVPFPLLVAGQRDKSSATETLGALDRVRAYPTFVFIDASGAVTGVHQGFIGPADPERHAALRAAFDERIDALLAGS